jgi:hypothetical protein
MHPSLCLLTLPQVIARRLLLDASDALERLMSACVCVLICV